MNHHHGHEHANGHHQVNGEQPTEEELDAYQNQLTHEAIQDQVKVPSPPFPSPAFTTLSYGQTFFIAQEKRVLLYHDYEEYFILILLLGVY